VQNRVVLVPDKRLDCLGHEEKIVDDQKAKAFYPGLVSPPILVKRRFWVDGIWQQ